jgi:hypothetical protein
VGRDSVELIATCYGLDGAEDRVLVGTRFSAPVQTGPGGHPASFKMVSGLFLEIKAAVAWR